MIVDSAFLGYVVGDSDLTVWIGTTTDPFNNHLTLSDAVLTSLGFTEVNDTALTSTRTADFNAGDLAGNVLVIAAKTGRRPTTTSRSRSSRSKSSSPASTRTSARSPPAASATPTSATTRTRDCVDVTYAFAGNTATTGTNGNIRTYTQNGVSVNVSGFSRTTAGTWNTAYLGAYSDGLGVTDTSENGSNGTHRVDNVGRVNFVLFEFSTMVEVDRAFLDSVVGDSDVSVWIGTADNPFHNHLTLSDSLLGIAVVTPRHDTERQQRPLGRLQRRRDVQGNVLVIAARVDTTPTTSSRSRSWTCVPRP